MVAHRLCAIVSHAPTAQVEQRALLSIDLAYTQFISEIRAAAMRHSIARNCVEPSKRVLEKSRRRHQVTRKSHIERLNDAVNQPHIVKVRQPCQAYAFWCVLESFVDIGGVVEQISVTNHNALGGSR